MSRSWSLGRSLVVPDQSAQRERGLAVAYLDPPSSSLSLIGSRDSHLATREYFPVFHIVHPAFVLLSDLLFFRYYIMPYDNCVLVLLLLDCNYHCAYVLWFLPVLMLSVYTLGYFWPAYIRRSNVSVPSGSGRYRVVLEPGSHILGTMHESWLYNPTASTKLSIPSWSSFPWFLKSHPSLTKPKQVLNTNPYFLY